MPSELLEDFFFVRVPIVVPHEDDIIGADVLLQPGAEHLHRSRKAWRFRHIGIGDAVRPVSVCVKIDRPGGLHESVEARLPIHRPDLDDFVFHAPLAPVVAGFQVEEYHMGRLRDRPHDRPHGQIGRIK